MARGFWGGIGSFWGIGHKCRMVYKGCSSHSECNPVPLCHLWQEKKLWPRHHGIVFQESRQNWIKQGTRTRTCAIDVRCEWKCSLLYLLLLTILQLYHFPPPLPSPVSSSCLFTQCLYETGLLKGLAKELNNLAERTWLSMWLLEESKKDQKTSWKQDVRLGMESHQQTVPIFGGWDAHKD